MRRLFSVLFTALAMVGLVAPGAAQAADETHQWKSTNNGFCMGSASQMPPAPRESYLASDTCPAVKWRQEPITTDRYKLRSPDHLQNRCAKIVAGQEHMVYIVGTDQCETNSDLSILWQRVRQGSNWTWKNVYTGKCIAGLSNVTGTWLNMISCTDTRAGWVAVS
jgi:hypothetical protein